MQIKGLYKNIYRLSQYALSQEKAADRRKRYLPFVKGCESAKAQGCVQCFAKNTLESLEQLFFDTNKS